MGVNKPEDKKLGEAYDTSIGHVNKLIAEVFPSAIAYLSKTNYPVYVKHANDIEATVRRINAKTPNPTTLFSAPKKPDNPNPNSHSQENGSNDPTDESPSTLRPR